jgi:hypothetical protein
VAAESSSTSTTSATVDSSTTGTSAASSEDWSLEQQEVIDGYLAARDAFSASLESPDPADPALAATHVDPMLAEVRNTNAEWLGFGQAGRFPDGSVAFVEPLSVEVDGDTATIETCGVDDSIVYDTTTGEVLDDDVVTVQATSTLVRDGGIWKLSTRSEVQRWEGVAGCALDFS